MHFPLMRLPFVALKEIIKCMTLFEMYSLSTISSRFAGLVMRHNAYQEMVIKVYFSEFPLIEIENVKSSIGNLGKHSLYQDNTFMKDIDNFHKFFPNFKAILIIDKRSPEFIEECFAYYKSRGIEIVEADISTYHSTDELFMSIFENCKNADRLRISCQLSETFVPEITFFGNTIKIDYGDWVNLGHLTETFKHCDYIYLRWCRFQEDDFVFYFKYWVENESPLQYASFPIGKTLLSSISEQMPSAANGQHVWVENDFQVAVQLGPTQFFIIEQQISGRKAVLCNYGNRLIFTTKYVL